MSSCFLVQRSVAHTPSFIVRCAVLRSGGRVFITGASGFVGRALTAYLLKNGYAVRVGVRRSQTGMPVGPEVFMTGDVALKPDWSQALSGVDAVVHLAARVHEAGGSQDDAAYWPVNVTATLDLARQASAAGVKRMLFLSTVKVLGETSPGRPLTDADPPNPQGAYARSKFAAEQGLMELAAATGLEVVILRPTLVYGPGVGANFLSMIGAVARGWPVPIGASQARRSFCYVGNLVAAVRACLIHPEASGQRFLVADAETLPLPEIVRQLATLLGRHARLPRVPASLLRALAGLAGREETVRRLFESLDVDVSGIRIALGWLPPVTLAEGLAETVRWYRESVHA